MKKAAVVLAAVALLLSGCASSEQAASTPSATPTVEESVNAEACEAFGEATGLMEEALTGDEIATVAWEEVRSAVDAAALSAESDVKERISALVSDWPDVGDVVIYPEARTEMNQHINDIDRACSADGAETVVYTFSEG